MMDEKMLKMKLLEQLMSEMDDSVSKRLKPKDGMVEVTKVEQEEMPIEDVEAMIEDKLTDPMEGEFEEGFEEDEDDYGDSRMMQKLMELKKKKAEME